MVGWCWGADGFVRAGWLVLARPCWQCPSCNGRLNQRQKPANCTPFGGEREGGRGGPSTSKFWTNFARGGLRLGISLWNRFFNSSKALYSLLYSACMLYIFSYYFKCIMLLAYCISVHSSANSTSLNKLRLKQKEAIRIITNSGYRDHTAPLFAQLKILPLDQLIKYNALKFMHSYHNNTLPISFYQMWTLNRERNPDRVLRNADQFYVPPPPFCDTQMNAAF